MQQQRFLEPAFSHRRMMAEAQRMINNEPGESGVGPSGHLVQIVNIGPAAPGNLQVIAHVVTGVEERPDAAARLAR
jgi:hypothetical protein